MGLTVEIERRPAESARPEWVCPSCHEGARLNEIRSNLMVCAHCGFHVRIASRERIGQLADGGSFVELWPGLRARDPLSFVDLETYPERIREAQAKAGINDALVVGRAKINGIACVLGVLDFSFMGGSMGGVVGEKFWRAAELAASDRLPLVVVASSGGARMQEGILSLMQMAKVSCAVDLLAEAGKPFISIMADPCTGGVVASFATLADICIAEPGARLYFSGPRVIQQTTREELPEGFSTAERNLQLGHLDAVVPRVELREKVGKYLRLLEGGEEADREEDTTGGRPRREGGVVKQALARVKALAAYARRSPVGGDRETSGKA